MRAHSNLVVLVALGSFLAGCPSGPGAPTTPVTFDEFVTEISAVDCDFIARCYGNDAILSFILRSTITDCRTQFAQYLDEQGYVRYREAIAAGTIVFHGDSAAACLAAFDSLTCSTAGTSYYDSCLPVFEGRVADGGACTFAAECASGGSCSGAIDTTCGTCSPAAHAGQACSTALPCTTGTICSEGICRVPAAQGAACDPSATQPCQTGLTCTATSGNPSMGTCTAPATPTLGMPCTITAVCAAGLVCGTVGGMATCRPPRTDGTCQATFLGTSDCSAGTVCSAGPTGSTDGTCVPTPTLGQACTSICAAPARCVSGMCVPTRLAGESCTNSDDCLSALCTAGTCTLSILCTH